MDNIGHGNTISQIGCSSAFINGAQSTFGHMFPFIAQDPNRTIEYTSANRGLLEQLGQVIGTKSRPVNSVLPAGYTYLGQFIDHDITLDPFSDINVPHDTDQVKEIKNFRIPCLDLDSIYGHGPRVSPYLYVNNSGDPQEDGIKLLLGINTPTGPGGPRNSSGQHIIRNDFDVPRTSNSTAIIGDPRNNENLFVSQLHHAFLKFHNKVVDHFKGTVPNDELFEKSRMSVVLHYQWIVLHDFLKRIAIPAQVDASINNQRFFNQNPFRMPVEFSAAAFRFGHTLVREEYDFNDNFVNSDFMNAFIFIQGSNTPVLSNWVVDMNRFFDTGNSPTLNIARAFDTALAPQLQSLPGHPGGSFMASLAKRNLVRGMSLSLPTGQAVADRLNVTRLQDSEIINNSTQAEVDALNANGQFLLNNTPLWYYILKEAEIRNSGITLGRVGSIIVAETFTRILRDDDHSILTGNSSFIPGDLPRIAGKQSGDFDMADLLNFAEVLS